MNRLVTGMIAGVGGVMLLFPHAAAFSQCNRKPDPPPKILVDKPGERVCCSLGTQTGIDPENLTYHDYGNQATLAAQTAGNYGGEPDGYIYTSAAGMVDIGHVRDNADMVFFVYIQLLDGQHTIYLGDQAGVPLIPTDNEKMMGLAGAIVFTNSWAHELTTWGDTNMFISHKAQDFSAFSPEDMSSNIVGIEAATRAIRAMQGGAMTEKIFGDKMDAVLPAMLATLGAQSVAVTNQMLVDAKFIPGNGTDLTAKWWMDDKLSPGNLLVRLLRRNFDGAAWKIPSGPQLITPSNWLNTERFSNFYSQFLYLVDVKTDVDATEVPNTSAYARASGLTRLAWTNTPFQSITADAYQVEGWNDVLCLATRAGAVITHGQFTQVKVNVDPPPSQDVIWSFAHATQFLQDNFVAANPNMAGPVMYVPPANSTPATH